MDKMYTGLQGCYKQAGKVKKVLNITMHEGEWTKEPFWYNVSRSGMIVEHAGHTGNDKINVPAKT
jgi:hypothetical protein